MNTNQIKVFETQALRCLGGSCKRNRTDLRKLPHEIIDRGRRMSQARLYKVEDVLKLRRAHFAQWSEEIKRAKKADS
jgi:hypothetical protein